MTSQEPPQANQTDSHQEVLEKMRGLMKKHRENRVNTTQEFRTCVAIAQDYPEIFASYEQLVEENDENHRRRIENHALFLAQYREVCRLANEVTAKDKRIAELEEALKKADEALRKIGVDNETHYEWSDNPDLIHKVTFTNCSEARSHIAPFITPK